MTVAAVVDHQDAAACTATAAASRLALANPFPLSQRRRLPARRRASSGSSGGGLSPVRRGQGGGARTRGGGMEEAQEDAGRWGSGGGLARATAVGVLAWEDGGCPISASIFV